MIKLSGNESKDLVFAFFANFFKKSMIKYELSNGSSDYNFAVGLNKTKLLKAQLTSIKKVFDSYQTKLTQRNWESIKLFPFFTIIRKS